MGVKRGVPAPPYDPSAKIVVSPPPPPRKTYSSTSWLSDSQRLDKLEMKVHNLLVLCEQLNERIGRIESRT